MIDPKKAYERLRRRSFRLDVLEALTSVAVSKSVSKRRAIDCKIWEILAVRGISLNDSEQQLCADFVSGRRPFGEYSTFVESKVNAIRDVDGE